MYNAPALTAQTLQTVLARCPSVPADAYCVGQICNEALCLIREGNVWKVFYAERGLRTGETVFTDETAAAASFIRRLAAMLNIHIPAEDLAI